MDTSQLDVLSARFERLERDHRRLKRLAGLGVFAGLALLVGVANSDDRPKTVEAEKIVLRGKDGKPRFLLEMTPDDLPNLTFFDKGGNSRITLGMGTDPEFGRPGLDIQGENNDGGIGMSVSRSGLSSLILSEPDGQQLCLQAIPAPEHCTELTFGHVEKADKLRISSRPEESVIQFIEKETTVLDLGVDDKGEASLFVRDQAGKDRLTLGRKPDGSPFLKLLDQDGKALFQSP